MLSLLDCHEDYRDHPPHYRKEPAATSSRMNKHCVALLGRRDEPTDAVEDYCRYLGAALQPLGFSMSIERLCWSELGWRRARRELHRRAEQWRDGWVFLQYTALAWSRRGFPLAVLRVLRELRTSGARTAVVFHDAEPYGGNRAVDYLRRMVQLRAMRKALRLADFAVTTLPAEKISWLPADCPKTVFIPVGANLPSPEDAWRKNADLKNELPTVAVFTVTGDANEDRAGQEEVDCIAKAVRCAAGRVGAIRVALLGRNSERAEKRLRERVDETRVKIDAYGLLEGEAVVRVLRSADVLLFARGPISTGRSSAIAGIACGLPVIACQGWETAPPITEAGVVLVPQERREEFGPALARVLSDAAYRASLAERSRRAQEKYFSWSAIAAKYAEAMRANSSQH